MNRIILRLLNAPGLILITTLGIAIQTSLFRVQPLSYFQPDLVLLVVIWCALKRTFTEGGIITLIVANITELHSASPQGLYLITYMGLYLTVRGLSRLLVIPHLSSWVTLTLFASAYFKLLGLFVLYLLGASANQWQHTTLYLFPGALVQAAICVWVYRWLEKYDWNTFKMRQDEDSLEEKLELGQQTL